MSTTKTTDPAQGTLKTTIHFSEGKIGHMITSEKPKIIHLPQANHLDNVKIIALILDTCLFKSIQPIFIVNSLKYAMMLNYAIKACNKDTMVYLPYLHCRTPSIKEKKELFEGLQNSKVLITDHKSLLGMEYEFVVTVIDPTEMILRHSFVEIISRATSYLTLFVVPSQEQCKVGSMTDVIEAWKDKDLVNSMHVTMDKEEDECGAIQICDGNAIIYTKSQRFTSFSKMFSESIGENIKEDLSVDLTRCVLTTVCPGWNKPCIIFNSLCCKN